MLYRGGENNWYSLKITTTTVNLEFTHNTVKRMLFQDAADYTAVSIASKFSNLYVLMSGGLDSEFVAHVFHRNKIPFIPVIASIPKILDHYYALNWCQERGITPVFFEFKKNDPRILGHYCKNWKVHGFSSEASAVISFLLDYVKAQGGNAVIGEPALTNVSTNFYEPIGDMFSIGAIHLLPFLANTPNMPGGFFIYTPEILLSAALELDSSKNDAQARSKLYNIPYRPKIVKLPSHVDESVSASLLKTHPDVIDNELSCVWTRQDLIKTIDCKYNNQIP